MMAVKRVSNPAKEEADKLQWRAADPACSVWVAASAGAGKTKVLIDRVLRLMLAGTPPPRILCLTYTNAAAAEMANRLNERLAGWVSMADNDLIRELNDLILGPNDLTGPNLATAKITPARRLFASVLDAPGGMRIQTLHGFCQTVLRRFPIEAGVPPHFEVMDERSSAEMLAGALAAVLTRARQGADEALAAGLREISGLVQQDRFTALLASLLGERGRVRRTLVHAGGVPGLVAQLAARLGVAPGLDDAGIIADACSEIAFDGPGLRHAVARLAAGSTKDQERAAVIAHWLGDPDSRVANFPSYRMAFLTQKGVPLARLATKVVRDAEPVLRIEAERLVEVEVLRSASVVLRATAALLAIGAAVLQVYDEHKRLRGRLDYDDLVLETRALLDDLGAAWVLYKLDGGIDHILIDEAQDTSPDQWAVVEALAGEFFAGRGASDRIRTLFAVGDTKQSIFSFQGAAPAQFEAMRRQFRQAATQLDPEGGLWSDVPINISFRSTEAVLSAVDRVFAGPARAGVADDGDPIHHSLSRLGHAGRVEIWPPVGPLPVVASSPWEAPRDYGPAASGEVRLAGIIARTIGHWLCAGEMLPARGRSIRPGDVMVLVRRRTPFVEELVRALKDLSIPVAGVDRMVLTDQLAVMDLMALGQFLLLPEDDLTLAVVLKSPLVGLDDDDLFKLAYDRGGLSLWRRLVEKAAAPGEARFAAARAALGDLMARVDFLPPYELYAEILGARRGRKKLVARLGLEANDPIDEFLALALDYGQLAAPSLQGFLHWLRAGEGDIKRDLEQSRRDEVRIITVHGAKGLQAPIVFLPDTMRTPRHDGPALMWWGEGEAALPLWVPAARFETLALAPLRERQKDRRLDEYRRLLYVALTRAEDRLYIAGWRGRRDPPEDCWYNLVTSALAPIATPTPLMALLAGHDWEAPGLRLDGAQTAAPSLEEWPPLETAADAGLPPWARQVAPALPPTRPLAPSRPDDIEPAILSPMAGGDGRRFRRGLLIHRLLQSLPDLAMAERATACRRYLASPAHELEPTEQAEIASVVDAVLSDSTFAVLFQPGSLAEVAVGGLVGDQLIQGQIDRLAVTEEAVWIVDYKSQRPPPASPAAVSPVYLRQMAAYRALVAGIYGDRPVRCALLWTAAPSLMALDDGLLDRYAP